MTRCEYALAVLDQVWPLLPVRMNTTRATVQLLANGLQESRLSDRDQGDDAVVGPAVGLWQFELGSERKGGGVWGVFKHPASCHYLRVLCEYRGVEFKPSAIFRAIRHDDVLAAGVARLLLWTDSAPLPAIGDSVAAWDYYLRTWNPGKPHRDTWDALYAEALAAVREVAL